MTDSQEDLVRLAQEGQQYKALADQLAEALLEITAGVLVALNEVDLPTEFRKGLSKDADNAKAVLTKYRETVK